LRLAEDGDETTYDLSKMRLFDDGLADLDKHPPLP
jgi:hypothetical protein